jgi:hypothetical protein
MCTVKFIWLRILLLLGAIAAALILPRLTGTGARASSAPPSRKTVVVELFTSEGCSSCPPADELLGRLRQEKIAEGLEVIPLGLHVDYWNSLGWTDRFSSADYSRRQEKYADQFGIEGPYTPQMVVDGEQQFVGNDGSRARQAIVQAASRPQIAAIAITEMPPGKVRIVVNAPENVSGDVVLAVTEDNLRTKVGAGENTGRELRHWAVVRRLERLGSMSKGSFAATIPLNFAREWKCEDAHVVVFVQDPADGRIYGAAWTSVGLLSCAG